MDNPAIPIGPANRPAKIEGPHSEQLRCPACRNDPTLKAVCTICKKHGEVIYQHDGKGMTTITDLDGGIVAPAMQDPTRLPRLIPNVVQDVDNATMSAAVQRMTQIAQILDHVRAGRRLFIVPIYHTSALDGSQETTRALQWARTPQEAAFNATHNPQRVQWATQIGKVELHRNTPVIAKSLIDAILALPVPDAES